MHPTTRHASDHVRGPLMPRLSRRALLAASAGAALMTAGGPTSLAAQSTPPADGASVLTIPIYPHGEALSLDPHRASNWGPHWVMLPHAWAGLMGFDEHGAAVPVLASSLEPEEDGAVWVATIRDGATFATGNPVTADAMIQGWRRALDPLRLSPMSSYMRRVEGFEAYVAREAEEIGFEARDETTVAIRLAEPYALFAEDLATFVWAAVDVSVLEGVADADVPFTGASAGQWQFAPSDDPAAFRMVGSPSATALPSGFNTVTWQVVDGPTAADTALATFQAGGLQLADVPSTLRQQVQDDAALQPSLRSVEAPGSTMLIGMDFQQAPFDNPAVRQAVAAAIDRERWAAEIMQGTFTAATGITPPVLSTTSNYAPPEPLPFDADLARSLLVDAGIDEASMPQVTYYQPAASSQAELDQAASLLAMITENSGLVIEHDTTLSAEQIEALRNDNGGLQFDIRWWWPLTSSPSGLADLGLPESPAMQGWFNWSPTLADEGEAQAAEEFATLVREALVSLDDTDRLQTFAQAEELLIQQVVYIPLGHWVQAWVQSPGLTGTRQGAFTGYVPVALDVEVSYQPVEGSPAG